MIKFYLALVFTFISLSPYISSSESFSINKHKNWKRLQHDKKIAYQNFLNENKIGLQEFVRGSNGKGETPALMFRVFQQLFPEIWGSEENQFNLPGLGPSTIRSLGQRYIPNGMALSEQRYDVAVSATDPTQFKKLNYVGFNCAACHTGNVRANGELIKLYGAPSNRINGLFFKVSLTSQHPNFNIQAFREAFKKIPNKEFNDPKSGFDNDDLSLFMSDAGEKIVSDIKAKSGGLLSLAKSTYIPLVYQKELNNPDPLGLKRGTNDALVATLMLFSGFIMKTVYPTDPQGAMLQLRAGLPTTPAETDNPSIWAQSGKGLYSHWDGTFTSLFHRNVATAAATQNTPVNFKNMELVTDFIKDLPPPVYPFEVDLSSARRGQKLFTQYCSQCHSGKTKIYDYNSVATSPNRFFHAPTPARAVLAQQMISRCVICKEGMDPLSCSTRCAKEDGSPYLPEEVASSQPRGYISDNLDGLWARAPYLHNGSVPTLYHLLVPKSRPKTFYRGSYMYDSKMVGFSWRTSIGDVKNPRIDTLLFETSKEGYSNQGHDSLEYLGLDWGTKKNTRNLSDMLEYLKTL